MLIVVVFFLLGGLLTRYGCQAFLPNGDNITGLVYAATRIDPFEFNNTIIELDLNTAILQVQLQKDVELKSFRECKNDKGLAEAFGLGEVVDDFIAEANVEGQIEEALEMVNTTYDDVVNEFEFDDYIETLTDVTIPDVSEISGKVETVSITLDTLSANLTAAQNYTGESEELSQLITQLRSLNSSVNAIETDVNGVIDNVDGFADDLESVKDSISSLEADLKSPTSTVKNDIYAEASFIKINTVAFIDQFADSLINQFGSCQVTFLY